MDTDRLKAAQKLFKVPKQFFNEANLMVKESEWELILVMGADAVHEKDLCVLIQNNKLAFSAPDFIWECYHRAVLNKVPREDGSVSFDRDKCWGCTICSANCPKDAIELVPKAASGEPSP